MHVCTCVCMCCSPKLLVGYYLTHQVASSTYCVPALARAVKAGWERGVAAAGAPCSPAGVSPRPEHIASTAAGDVRGFPNGHVGRDARPPRVPGLPLHTHSGGWGPAPRTPRPPPGKRVGCPPASWAQASLRGSTGALLRASPLLPCSSCGSTDAAQQAARAG